MIRVITSADAVGSTVAHVPGARQPDAAQRTLADERAFTEPAGSNRTDVRAVARAVRGETSE